MVHWYHVILSAYGFWLPNDPRGSWSDFVYAWDLFRFGGSANRVHDRRSYAHDPHDVLLRVSTKVHLKYPAARFNLNCRQSIAVGFKKACGEFGFVLHACAIGHDHVHIVVARDADRNVEQIASVLKARATREMNIDETNPLRLHRRPAPTPWGVGCWKVFINDEAQLRSAIDYVDRHPLKEGMPAQNWDFVSPV